MSELSCAALSVKVPGGEPWRNWPKGILTAPVRNCANAKLADKGNNTPGRDKTCAASSLGSRARISFNGKEITSPVCVRAGLAAGAGGGGAETAGGCGGGAAVGGGLPGFQNSFLKSPNMDRAISYNAKTQGCLSMAIFQGEPSFPPSEPLGFALVFSSNRVILSGKIFPCLIDSNIRARRRVPVSKETIFAPARFFRLTGGHDPEILSGQFRLLKTRRGLPLGPPLWRRLRQDKRTTPTARMKTIFGLPLIRFAPMPASSRGPKF
jgi:hypothetical protein